MAGIALLKIIGVPLPNLPELVLIASQAALGWLMGTRFDAIPMRRFASLALACFSGLAAGVGVVIVAGVGLIALTSLPAREWCWRWRRAPLKRRPLSRWTGILTRCLSQPIRLPGC